jgi:glutaredoxin
MMKRIALLSVAFAAALTGAVSAQSLYRYLDANGRVVYSDQPPPPTAKDVQPRQLPQNVIDTDPMPLAARQAAERFPVTLYTFDCEICKDAKALLDKRGIPYQTVIVSEEKGAAELKALTGKHAAPVLRVGDKELLQGYSEQRWQAVLDDAGYPRTVTSMRREPARTAQTTRSAVTPAAKTEGEPPPPAPGQGYPK